jgi:hypothetical protein
MSDRTTLVSDVEPEFPGDVYWYDLPDDEAEPEDGPAPRIPSLLLRLIPWRTA